MASCSRGEPPARGVSGHAGLLQLMAVAANEATTVEEAMQSCLDTVCGYCGWPVGHYYAPTPDGTQLLPSAVWHLDDPDRFDAFRRATALRLHVGQGLPGRVLATARPAWVADLGADDDFPRTASANAVGLCSAFAFPVLAGREAVGVLEFFSTIPAEPDPALLETMAQIGSQLGRVVERSQAAAALYESEERLRLVLDTASDAFVAMDAEGIITSWNCAAERLFGWSAAEAVGQRLSATIIPVRHRAAHERGLAHFLATGEAPLFGRRIELETLHRDGHEVPMELSIWPVRGARSVQFNAFIHDITERRQAAAALREATERFRRAFEDAPIGMVLVDLTGRILQANRAYCDMLGYSRETLLAMRVIDLTHPDDVEVSGQLLRRAVAGELSTYRLEKRYLHARGHPVWSLLSVSAVADAVGDVAYFIGQIEDISTRKDAEDTLTRQALHDSLTGLANRSLMLDRLRQALARAERAPAPVAVLFVDLDDFKAVNDSMGHEAGDQVLCVVAERLVATVRPSDTVCRLGGDEFVVVCEELESEDEARVIASRVDAAVSRPLVVSGREMTVTASVGVAVAVAQRGAYTAELLLRDADTAMYQAKGQGKARHAVYDADLRLRADERVQLERGLREALEAGHLRLVFQPIVELTTAALVGAEALVRYDDPERGVLVADQFIDVAEDSGLIVPLGTWVLEQACQEAARWRRQARTVPLTVNLSARQMAHPNLVATVHAALERAGLGPASLSLDLPEMAMMEAEESVLQRLVALREFGVRLGINGWGTGPASVTALEHLPVDYVKVDRRLVGELSWDRGRTSTVRALVDVGRAFELTTVAQGVESAEQLAVLQGLGCHLGQGNHLGRPQPPGALPTRPGREAAG